MKKLQPAAVNKHLEVLEVILIRVGVVRVAGVAPHGNSMELAAEMIFQSGAGDLSRVVQILGTDETDDGVDEKRVEVTREAVIARFQGLLIDPVVRIRRQRRALAGLEIHDVRARSPGRA